MWYNAGMNRDYMIALCQMTVTYCKDQNMAKAKQMVHEAATEGARIVCLPEIWNAPYDVELMQSYAETADGPSVKFMSEIAKENGIYLVGGSIPEIDGEKLYNTAFVFDPAGRCIARHRKVNLFDIDIEDGPSFKESDLFSAGEGATVFETEYGKIGLAICYDVRFPQMFKEMADHGCNLILLPASFTMTTGKAHWDVLLRSRALDNQIFFAACATARNPELNYSSWGHSSVLTPWGDYSGGADEKEAIVYSVINPDYCNKIRREIPIGNVPAL